ncbi:DUF3108 domain-containing protein [Lentisalinibacter sediminis]|uniref:DUF3108 domain-containing protein n=1 Tax=Lentisalinibacter sediminis TaxID=2992237 RepID=UPI003869CF97
MTPTARLLLVFLAAAAAVAPARSEPSEKPETAETTPPGLRPFVAVYEAKATVLGLGGNVTMQLAEAEEPGVYIFRNTSDPKGLANLVAGEEVECSRFRYDEDGFQPLHYHEDAGDDSSTVRFRPTAGAAVATYKGREATLELRPGTLDRATEQMVVRHELATATAELGPYTTIERNEYRTIEYRPEGTRVVDSPAGSYHTVAFRRQRVGSSRSVLIHYAPKLDWMPVMIEQFKGDKKQVTARLKNYRPLDPSPVDPAASSGPGAPSDPQARGSVTPRCP